MVIRLRPCTSLVHPPPQSSLHKLHPCVQSMQKESKTKTSKAILTETDEGNFEDTNENIHRRTTYQRPWTNLSAKIPAKALINEPTNTPTTIPKDVPTEALANTPMQTPAEKKTRIARPPRTQYPTVLTSDSYDSISSTLRGFSRPWVVFTSTSTTFFALGTSTLTSLANVDLAVLASWRSPSQAVHVRISRASSYTACGG